MQEEPIQQFIYLFVQPNPAEWEAFIRHVREDTFRKGDRLITAGKNCTRLFFLFEGTARHFYFNKNQEEITTWFSEAGSLVTDFAAYTTGAASIFEVEALTPLKGYSIAKSDLEQLYDDYKVWERLGRLVNQFYLIQMIERNNSMTVKTARQRYKELFEQQSHLFNLVPLKHIASYLGITLETLSRIRSDSY